MKHNLAMLFTIPRLYIPHPPSLPQIPISNSPFPDSEISDSESLSDRTPDESLTDRLNALRDIIPPQTRAKLTNTLTTTYNGAAKTVTFGGKSLWVICTSVLLLGLPYALAFQDEQMVQEEERQRQLMSEGASGLMSAGQEGQQGQTKAAL